MFALIIWGLRIFIHIKIYQYKNDKTAVTENEKVMNDLTDYINANANWDIYVSFSDKAQIENKQLDSQCIDLVSHFIYEITDVNKRYENTHETTWKNGNITKDYRMLESTKYVFLT